MTKYVLLRGGHEQGNGDTVVKYHANKSNGMSNIVESDKDLVKMFGPEKFRKLEDGETASGGVRTLEAMKLQELREFAEAEEIDLEGATLKKDVLAKITEWLAYQDDEEAEA